MATTNDDLEGGSSDSIADKRRKEQKKKKTDNQSDLEYVFHTIIIAVLVSLQAYVFMEEFYGRPITHIAGAIFYAVFGSILVFECVILAGFLCICTWIIGSHLPKGLRNWIYTGHSSPFQPMSNDDRKISSIMDKMEEGTYIPEGGTIDPKFLVRTIKLYKSNGKIGTTHLGTFISAVVPGSPADISGIRRGDQMISIDGVSVEALPFDTILDLLDSATGKIQLRVRYNPERLNDLEARVKK